nr:cofactor-independent phosphoglycerate mutase [Spirochaetota bacterium]
MENRKKYVILLGDGMADLPIDELGGKTVLEYAETPNMDFMASNGVCGMTRTVPEGMSPGSDTANLAIFGYDPEKYYTGRAPLEAVNMDIQLGERDVAFRCNIVNAAGGVMNDFTSDHIDSRLTEIVINELADKIRIPGIEFYPGVSYRNIVVWRDYPYSGITDTTPPHDIQTLKVEPHLPSGDGADLLKKIMSESSGIISSSEKIQRSKSEFKGNPESVWLWGGGRRPAMETLSDKFGLSGYTISAVDLIHGIGKAAGLKPLHVKGATGYLDTNYEGKAAALIEGLKKSDLVFLHVEAPDESGHEGDLEHKLRAIRDFDSKIVGPALSIIRDYSNFVILLMPDHKIAV